MNFIDIITDNKKMRLTLLMLKNKNTIAYLLVTIAPFLWAGNTTLARAIHEIIPPCSFSFWRWCLAFVILLPVSFNHLTQDWEVARRSWKLIILLSILGISGFNVLLYAALHTTTAINAALISSIMPAVVVISCFFIYKDKISIIQLLGIILCFAGTCYVILKGQLSLIVNIDFVKGDILLIVATIMYGIYSAMLPKVPLMHPLSFLTIVSGVGTLGLLPLYVTESMLVGTFDIKPLILLSILYVALLPSIVAYLCWNKGISMIGASRAGLFINLIPIFTSLMAIIFLSESLYSYHVVGMLTIFSGIVIFNRS